MHFKSREMEGNRRKTGAGAGRGRGKERRSRSNGGRGEAKGLPEVAGTADGAATLPETTGELLAPSSSCLRVISRENKAWSRLTRILNVDPQGPFKRVLTELIRRHSTGQSSMDTMWSPSCSFFAASEPAATFVILCGFTYRIFSSDLPKTRGSQVSVLMTEVGSTRARRLKEEEGLEVESSGEDPICRPSAIVFVRMKRWLAMAKTAKSRPRGRETD
jgi:hypothetical protein